MTQSHRFSAASLSSLQKKEKKKNLPNTLESYLKLDSSVKASQVIHGVSQEVQAVLLICIYRIFS